MFHAVEGTIFFLRLLVTTIVFRRIIYIQDHGTNKQPFAIVYSSLQITSVYNTKANISTVYVFTQHLFDHHTNFVCISSQTQASHCLSNTQSKTLNEKGVETA